MPLSLGAFLPAPHPSLYVPPPQEHRVPLLKVHHLSPRPTPPSLLSPAHYLYLLLEAVLWEAVVAGISLQHARSNTAGSQGSIPTSPSTLPCLTPLPTSPDPLSAQVVLLSEPIPSQCELKKEIYWQVQDWGPAVCS